MRLLTIFALTYLFYSIFFNFLKELSFILENHFHVYHFLLDHRIGGPHVYVDNFRQAMAGSIEAVVVTTGRGPMTEISLFNFRHFFYLLYPIEILLNICFIFFLVMTKKIKKKNAIFAVHGSANLAPIIAARILRMPLVWHLHETTSRFKSFVNFGKVLLNNSPHALAVVAKKSNVVYGLQNTAFLPGSVDPIFWSFEKVSSEEKQACKWLEKKESNKPLRLLAIGNLNPLKGMDILIDALGGISSSCHLKIVGASLATHQAYADCIYSKAADITNKKKSIKVEFLGWQDKTDVRALLASCDIFILPSRSEACPIVLLEAMSMQCTCLAADVGDVSLMLKSYTKSFVFAADSVSACQEAIENILRNPIEDFDKPSLIESHWQLNKVVDQTETLYRRVLFLGDHVRKKL